MEKGEWGMRKKKIRITKEEFLRRSVEIMEICIKKEFFCQLSISCDEDDPVLGSNICTKNGIMYNIAFFNKNNAIATLESMKKLAQDKSDDDESFSDVIKRSIYNIEQK